MRICSLQYYLRPIQKMDDFRGQVEALVETAADYKSRLVVFPEYFTAQLLTLNNTKGPIQEQIRSLARMKDGFVDLMSRLARENSVYICAGTIPVLDEKDESIVYNDCYFFNPKGEYAVQGKMHMTRFEREEWLVSPRDEMKIFETDFGRCAVAICYDVEFPEIARAAAREGAHILLVPSCTDERQGFLRVRYCAHARAIENQMYVVQSCTVGSIPVVPAVHLNYGQAAILTPSDFQFARDGILAEGMPNLETIVLGDVDLDIIERTRSWGTVLPLHDSQRTTTVASKAEIVRL